VCYTADFPNLYSSGLIHVGDELREVNGIPVEDKKPEEIIQILVSYKLKNFFKIAKKIKLNHCISSSSDLV
jgi:hypothetical protein